MNDKKFLTAIEPSRREHLLAVKEKEPSEYKELITDLKAVWKERTKVWRKGKVIEAEDKPLKPWKARGYGWKDKPGFITVKVRVRKGIRKRPQTSGGRKPSKSYDYKPMGKSKQVIAEEKVAKRYPNCEVLASYWLWEDGQFKWFEIILVDTHGAHIKNDKDINWICKKTQKGRAFRAMTPAGKKSRGLTRKGKGAEKLRPSLKANKNRGK